jgi:hypothetical protein
LRNNELVNVQHVRNEEEEEILIDMNDELFDDADAGDEGDDDDDAEEEEGEESKGNHVSKAQKTNRGIKRLKGGSQPSPSKDKSKRGKRAGCWKYFKEIHVQSKKEFGVMVTKAKCKFYYKSYAYHPGGNFTVKSSYTEVHTVSEQIG